MTTPPPPAVLMLDLQGPVLQAAEADLLLNPVVGGVILFARNYTAPAQLADLTAAIRQQRADMLIAVDQEGGRVQRFREGFLPLPSLYSLANAALSGRSATDKGGAAGEEGREPNLQLVSNCAWAMAAELLHHGIDFSFAPVLDVYNPASKVIAERAFAATPEQTVPLARAYIEGMHAAGMAATGKHYPGHGTVEADSHHELPVDERSREQILASDYRVFADCIGQLEAIMPAHIVYPAVDDVCAGFSRVWIQELLRDALGFTGVVFSDDLGMAAAAVTGPVEARAEAALEAGCDMVLLCNHSAEAGQLAKWLERQAAADGSLKAKLCASRQRQSAMVAKPAPEIATLYQSERWREVLLKFKE
ncbi:MAG: beta-N-acetylhexosaminidase [Pseudohongiellaceae bacterium]